MTVTIDSFKAYDIRGQIPNQLNPDICYRIGNATAEFLGAKRVVVGRDMRLSSEEFADAVARGLEEAGVEVLDIGLCGTEMVYFATMHDLKNLIAQQSMVVENAQRHKNNPQFIDDAIETIKGGVVRMRRVIDHLSQRSAERPVERIELGKLVMQAVSQCADREPVPRAIVEDGHVWVRGDRDRLLMAVYHAIRNAQDATPSDGSVSVELKRNGAECAVHVIDTGSGMGQIVFVIEARVSSQESAMRALALLDRDKPINAILNKSKSANTFGYHSDDYGYYPYHTKGDKYKKGNKDEPAGEE